MLIPKIDSFQNTTLSNDCNLILVGFFFKLQLLATVVFYTRTVVANYNTMYDHCITITTSCKSVYTPISSNAGADSS